MKKRWHNFVSTIGLIIFIIVVINTHALAGKGCGYKPNVGCGYHYRWNEIPLNYTLYGYGKKPIIAQEISAFLNDTKDLREQLFNKKQQLTMELDKAKMDKGLAMKIQGELSKLQTVFDKKWTQHIIKMKEIDPNYRRKTTSNLKGYCRY
jgi:hypothetical protein